MMHQRVELFMFLILIISSSALAGEATRSDMFCVHAEDTYGGYDKTVNIGNRNKSEFYVLSYSWAPGYCAQVKKQEDKKPGEKDFLQCGSGINFGYVLHGLWPQGTLSNPMELPRACEGDMPKIPREILNKYLCMTPSVWLLQHEYESHGTCMPMEFRDADKYFSKAMEMHNQLKLPEEQINDQAAGMDWFKKNNPKLPDGSVYFSPQDKEWRVCFDESFKPFTCPAGSSSRTENPNVAADEECIVKGNIARNGKRYYFLSTHKNYLKTKIDLNAGERCFSTEEDAIKSGWIKAP